MKDSATEHRHVVCHDHSKASHGKKKSSISSPKPLSLHYPSVFGSPFSPSHLNSVPVPVPRSVPELSLSDDEDNLSDSYNIPELSLEDERGVPMIH